MSAFLQALVQGVVATRRGGGGCDPYRPYDNGTISGHMSHHLLDTLSVQVWGTVQTLMSDQHPVYKAVLEAVAV